jgi:2-polyprenyl-6-methoxyphenol hydroxylase-like FAD-dependent oxidoreductase
MREAQTEVLVVGAGPVGLWMALLLAEAGISVSIIDQEAHTAARSYACALHSRTLDSLARLGLTEELLKGGKCVDKLGFYDHAARRAELDFSAVAGRFPFMLILPQSSLERLLEQKLVEAGGAVHWNHRFASFVEGPEWLDAVVEELAGTSTGYIVPHWEMVVKSRSSVRAQFIIGADGHGSLVRQLAGFNYERLGDPEFFAAFEFESRQTGENDEVRVALNDTTNVLWPLPNSRYRWTFQVLRHELPAQFPEKERRAVRLAQPMVDERIRQYVEKVSQHRATWFSAKMDSIGWCSEVAFERRLVRPFGQNRCWLIGDAAHQTGPVGVQSMNLGFREAESLTALLKRILREDAPLNLLELYNREQRSRWEPLMGLTGGLRPRAGTPSWIRQHCGQLLPCLPGCEAHLSRLADQLSLDIDLGTPVPDPPELRDGTRAANNRGS